MQIAELSWPMMPGSAIIVDIRWKWWRSPNLSPSLRLNLNLNHSLNPNLSLNLNLQSLSILVSRLLEPLLSQVKWCFPHGRIPILNHSPNLSLSISNPNLSINSPNPSPGINNLVIKHLVTNNLDTSSLSLKKRKRTVAVSLWRLLRF